MELRIVLLTALVVLGATFSALAPPTAPAAAITLQNSTAHACTFSGLTTAIAEATTGDTITFDCPANTIIAFTDEIVIDKSLTIDGTNGDNSITFDGGNTTRLFKVASSGELTLRRLTLQHGSASTGGAISISGGGVVTIHQSNVIDNESTDLQGVGGGGAIENGGTLVIRQSRFANNSANDSGGAISSTGTLEINRSTFIGNTAKHNGGAILIINGTLDIFASTFADNTATGGTAAGGSVLNLNIFAGSAAIRWSTIIQPEGTDRALALWKPITLEGVILGGAGNHCKMYSPDVVNATNSLANDDSCIAGETADWENQDLKLANVTTTTVNGVPQTYYPLDTGSPAIDVAGDVCREPDNADEPALPNDAPLNEAISTVREILDLDELDQIGTLRPLATSGPQAACDIGAIEMTNVAPVTATITLNNPPFLEGQPNAIDFVVTNHEPGAMYLYINGCRTEESFGFPITAISSPSTTQEINCIPDDQGAFIIWVAIGNGTSVRESFISFDVLNVDPNITSFTATPTSALTGELITLSATADDVPADPLFYTYACGGGTHIGDNQCRFERGGGYYVSVLVTDGDGGETTDTRTIQVFDPVDLCANRWSGSLRVADDCGRSENNISLPLANYTDLSLCVNQWNGATRVSDRCDRSEQLMTTQGQDTLHVCINQWNGTMRVSDQCSRSEYEDWL